MSISFFSLNIEADRHLNLIIDYLLAHRPDVIQLQEIYRVHAESWADELGYSLSFAPNVDFTVAEHIFKPIGEWGVATLTKHRPDRTVTGYYSEPPIVIPHEFIKVLKHPRSYISTYLTIGSLSYCFINTHFTWALSDNHTINPLQWADYQRFQSILDKIPSFILSGDLNLDRGSKIYQELNSRYIDHLPKNVASTLDPQYFRKPELKLVVDHLFSTSDYACENVEVISGLSDHCAIIAQISKTT